MNKKKVLTNGLLARLVLVALILGLAGAEPADAYIGPGAGFALLSSFMVLFTTILLAIVALLVWPFRMLWRAVRRRPKGKASIKRFIVVGLDGQDPELTRKFMAEGKLPNFEKLAAQGSFSPLESTFPSISPVAML